MKNRETNIVPFKLGPISVRNARPKENGEKGFFGVNKDLMLEAYSWADSDRRKKGVPTTPYKVDFVDDKLYDDNGNCFISIFVNGDGKAIMRREWDDDYSVVYNTILNYDTISEKAPNAVMQMLQNAIISYKKYGKGYRAFYLMKNKR